MIKQLSHICFGTTDIEGTIAFYQNTFGFEVAHEFRNAKNELYGVFLRVGGDTYLEFFKTQEDISIGTQLRHICFAVEDIHEAASELATKGFSPKVMEGKTDHILHFWIEDPNGIRIEFHPLKSCLTNRL